MTVGLIKVWIGALGAGGIAAGCAAGHQVAGDPVPASTLVAPMTGTTGARTTPPDHFRIGGDDYGPVYDCRVERDVVSCTVGWDEPYGVDTYTGTVTGTLSGQTMTGTSTIHQTGHDEAKPGCLFTVDITGPVTYVFDAGGTVSMRQGESRVQWTNGGACSGSESSTNPRAESSAPWTPVE